MHITRIGLTPLKGARHTERPHVRLDPSGPRDDRLFCLLDADRDRVVRTVETPRVVLMTADWDGHVLTVATPEGAVVSAAPQPTGAIVVADYWGRSTELEIMHSPHADLVGAHLGRAVRLARVTRPGDVVYAGSVSIVTSGALARLGETSSDRFRSTLTLDAEHDPAPGAELRIGDAILRVIGPLPRCRVVDINPGTGELDTSHLTTLAAQVRGRGEVPFGVDAEVLVPGLVRAGDEVTTQPGSVVPS